MATLIMGCNGEEPSPSPVSSSSTAHHTLITQAATSTSYNSTPTSTFLAPTSIETPKPTENEHNSKAYYFLIDISGSVENDCVERRDLPLLWLKLLAHSSKWKSDGAVPSVGFGLFHVNFEPVLPISSANDLIDDMQWYRTLVNLRSNTKAEETNFVEGLDAVASEFSGLSSSVEDKYLFIFSDGEFYDRTKDPKEIKDALRSLKNNNVEIVMMAVCKDLDENYMITWDGFVQGEALDHIERLNEASDEKWWNLWKRLTKTYFGEHLPNTYNWLLPADDELNSVGKLEIPGATKRFDTHMISINEGDVEIFNQDDDAMNVEFKQLGKIPGYYRGEIAEYKMFSPLENCSTHEWKLRSSSANAFGVYWSEFSYPLFHVETEAQPNYVNNYSFPITISSTSKMIDIPPSQWNDYSSCFEAELFVQWNSQIRTYGSKNFKEELTWEVGLPNPCVVKCNQEVEFFTIISDREDTYFSKSPNFTVDFSFHPVVVFERASIQDLEEYVIISIPIRYGTKHCYESSQNVNPIFVLITPHDKKKITSQAENNDIECAEPHLIQNEMSYFLDDKTNGIIIPNIAKGREISYDSTDHTNLETRIYELKIPRDLYWNDVCDYKQIGIFWENKAWKQWVCTRTSASLHCNEIER